MGLGMSQFAKAVLKYVSFAILISVLTLLLTYLLAPYLGFYIYSKQSVDELKKELSKYKIRNTISLFIGLSAGYVETIYTYAYMSLFALEKADYTASEEFINHCNEYLTRLKELSRSITNLGNKTEIDEKTKQFIKTFNEKLSKYVDTLETYMNAIKDRDMNTAKDLIRELAMLKDIISALYIKIT